MWTQYGMNDLPENSFKSGLRDDFDYGLPGPGTVRPAWTAWMDASGARPEPLPAEPPAPTPEPPTATAAFVPIEVGPPLSPGDIPVPPPAAEAGLAPAPVVAAAGAAIPVRPAARTRRARRHRRHTRHRGLKRS
jgi:hypothetical protein